MDDDYLRQLDGELLKARKRVEAGVSAANFSNLPEGQLVQEWVNLRVGLLIESMTAKIPLSDRDYLAAHGAIRELKDFNIMLQSKKMDGEAAANEVKTIDEQQRAIKGKPQE